MINAMGKGIDESKGNQRMRNGGSELQRVNRAVSIGLIKRMTFVRLPRDG